ncbi:MAG: chemotaxis protein CheW [Deltaproteobacteria bacterium]|nr:chemotaxis protein CheW [Deltaproteobacteria bacterium]
MKKQSQEEVVDHKVLICSATTPYVDGKQIYFLFSLYQVEDIQRELSVYDVPFSAPFIEGITVWRDLTIPVISLERYLGLPLAEAGQSQRFIVIRSALGTQEDVGEMRIAIRTERETKMISIPDSNELVTSNGWMNHELVKGVFEWDKGYIVVPETDKLFQGEISYKD